MFYQKKILVNLEISTNEEIVKKALKIKTKFYLYSS